MPMTVIMVGLLSFVMILWESRLSQRLKMELDLADAIMDMRIRTSSFHVLVEEDLYGERQADMERISGEIDMAISLSEAALNGGKSEHGQPIQSVEDPRHRRAMEVIHPLLTRFKTTGLRRMQYPNAAGIVPALYEEFNAAFGEIQDKAEALEHALERNHIRNRANSKRLLSGILLAWILLVGAAATGLWRVEARRRAAEKSLREANEQLQAQTRELDEHRGRLTELVEERTAELTRANLSLKREILERKLTEASLGASENKCRILVDYLPQKIYLKDQASVYVHCNNNFARDLGIKAAEIAGKTDDDFFPLETAEQNRAEDKKVMESGKPLDAEERHVKDGQEVVIHKFKMPARNDKGGVNGVLGILWDVTERVRLESIAEAATMMNNIGYIFAGVGHEIGNPINSAKMTLSVLKKRIDTYSKETVGEYLDRALGQIVRVEYLLSTLKSFNMYETPRLQHVEVKPFMDKFLSLLANDFEKKGITLDAVFDPGADWAYVDPRALQQVMLNIMSNASDALEGRENPKTVIQVSKADNTIRIKVTDNGCGISEEQQNRLFTPFFTTKSSGTGLGLVIAKKLLSKMEGTITIKSQRGEGTTMELSIQEGRNEL
jgi:PAS domain S-box-containing protein